MRAMSSATNPTIAKIRESMRPNVRAVLRSVRDVWHSGQIRSSRRVDGCSKLPRKRRIAERIGYGEPAWEYPCPPVPAPRPRPETAARGASVRSALLRLPDRHPVDVDVAGRGVGRCSAEARLGLEDPVHRRVGDPLRARADELAVEVEARRVGSPLDDGGVPWVEGGAGAERRLIASGRGALVVQERADRSAK